MRLLLVEDSAGLRQWLDVVRAAGFRYGWLRTGPSNAAQQMAAAADPTALRTVWATDSASVVVKPRQRPAPLRDLLREHFLGSELVLIERPGDTRPDVAERGWLEAAGHEVAVLRECGPPNEGCWEVSSLVGELVLRGDGSDLCRALARPRWLAQETS